MFSDSDNKRSSKKTIYLIVTVIVMMLASFTLGLTTAFFFKESDTNIPGDNTDTAVTTDTDETVFVTGPATEPVTEPITVPVTEPVTEPITEPVTETVPVTDAQTDPPDDDEASSVIQKLRDIEKEYPDTVLAVTEDMGEDYIERIIFLGDSTTYGLKKYGVLPGGTKTKQVWTPASGTLTLSYASFSKILYPEDGSEITIAEAVRKRKPDILVITLGVNGISFMDETYFKSEYSKLVSIIQKENPETKIILQSIFPVARSYTKKKSINNIKISDANVWIADIAAEAGVKYANTALALIGPDGYLPEEYQNGDGMHLNEISFGIELEYLRTHAYPEPAGSADVNNTEP